MGVNFVDGSFLVGAATDKSAFEGLKWTNEKKSKSLKSTDNVIAEVIEDKTCENGGCTDSNISTADQETTCTTVKEKVIIDYYVCLGVSQ